METSKKQLQTILKVLYIVFTFLFVGVCVIAFLLIGGVILLMALPEEMITQLMNGHVTAKIHLSGLEITLADEMVNQMVAHPSFLIQLVCIALGSLVVIGGIIFLTRKIVKSMKDGNIFCSDNSTRMKRIGYLFAGLSVILPALQSYLIYTFSSFFQLNDKVAEIPWIQTVSFQYSGIYWSLLLSGLVIWAIGHVFEYGTFLQEEYDATV